MMRDIHARYPFLSATKAAVAEDDPNIVDLVSDGGSETLNRALERARGAIRDREIGDRHPNPRVEVLSYPIGRILVSLTGETVACSRLARAEADAAKRELATEGTGRSSRKRGLADGNDPQSGETDREVLLDEFDLADALIERETGQSYVIPVPDYLPLAVAARDDEWKLRRRTVHDGDVHIERNEINDLVRAAVERRIADGLPVSVPNPVADELIEEMALLRDDLNEVGLIRDIDTVAPDLFPPCVSHILEEIRNGEHLEHHSRFAVTAFLGSIGMSTDEIVDLYTVNPGFAEEMTRYQSDHILGNTGPIEYSTPACETMKSHGDCHAPDDRCDSIKHPMAYYERALDETDDDEIDEWRDSVADDADDDSAADADADADADDADDADADTGSGETGGDGDDDAPGSSNELAAESASR